MESKTPGYSRTISKRTVDFTDRSRHIPQAAHVFCMRQAGEIVIPPLAYTDSSIIIQGARWSIIMIVDSYALLQHETSYMLAPVNDQVKTRYRVLHIPEPLRSHPLYPPARRTLDKLNIFAMLLEDEMNMSK